MKHGHVGCTVLIPKLRVIFHFRQNADVFRQGTGQAGIHIHKQHNINIALSPPSTMPLLYIAHNEHESYNIPTYKFGTMMEIRMVIQRR